MKSIAFIISLLLVFSSLNAQRRVALHHAGTTQIFGGTNPLTDAYNAAQNGDTIYVPGGLFSIPTIQKRIVLVGTGYFTDSLTATGKSQINGINIGDGASGTVITGFYIEGNLHVNPNFKIDSLFIFRNLITGDFGYPGGDVNKPDTAKSKGVIVAENRVNAIGAENVSDIKIFNNITRLILYAKNGWIRNNIILGESWAPFHTIYFCQNSLFENNFIYGSLYQSYNNTFMNNVFPYDPTTDLNNTYINSYINQPMNNVFVNANNQDPHTFSNDWHLQNPSAYPANNATQIGIYGGFYAFKEGSLPTNPHISFKNVATQTLPNGDLPIQIRVNAQQN